MSQDNLISDLGLMMLPHTISGTTLDVPGCPGTDGTSRTDGTLSWDRWDISDLGLMRCSHTPCREQPRMSQVVLGQMGHLGPGTDDAPTHHLGNNLGCPRLSWDRWDISDLGLMMMLPHTIVGNNLGCPRLSWDVPDNLR